MSDSTVQFSVNDKPNVETLKVISYATQYAEIQDLNGGNYQSGLITFSNVNLQNAMAGCAFDLGEALYHIPITYKATISDPKPETDLFFVRHFFIGRNQNR